MRKLVGMLSLGALAACSGQDPQSAGSVAVTGAQTTASQGTFVSPTQTKTYQATGAVQSYSYTYDERSTTARPTPTRNQTLQLYSADAATVRSPGITVSYDPRSAQYTLTISQSSVSRTITFQDPAHRTDFGGAVQPQAGVPNLQNQGVKYLQVRLSDDASTYDNATFFYEQPGTSTKYVTYAGYVRNHYEASGKTVSADGSVTDLTRKTLLERAAFVYGEQTAAGAVPTTGTATYSGSMIASMANNPDFENSQQTYFQWINGTQKTTVDFGASTVRTALTGTVGAPLVDAALGSGVPAPSVPIPQGSTFAANASAKIDTVFTGGFTGTVADAKFTTPAGAVQTVTIAGSSVDGAFYGPKAEEVGASFRIVGGVPDQRVDVIGSFTGAKP